MIKHRNMLNVRQSTHEFKRHWSVVVVLFYKRVKSFLLASGKATLDYGFYVLDFLAFYI